MKKWNKISASNHLLFLLKYFYFFVIVLELYPVVLSGHFWWCSGDHMGWCRSILGWPCARQTPYPLCYHSGPSFYIYLHDRELCQSLI